MRLLEPYSIGDLSLPNRFVMAPMTRNRAPGAIPNERMAAYYEQRASAGLIITEGTQISPVAQGYQDTPGIHTDAQGEGWRLVTDAVRAARGRIFAQLWHVGRISHSYYHGMTPVAPSPIPPPGKAYIPEGSRPYETPHELTIQEIGDVVEQFRHASRVARDAGFDGVEIHGANGYLIDQFLRTGTNQRTDRYGDSVANRCRFLLEVTSAVMEVWSGHRVGVRLSPGGTTNGAVDEDPVATFSAAFSALDELDELAYLHIVEAPVGTSGPDERAVCATELARSLYSGTLITTGGYTPEAGEHLLEKECANLIGFGRLYIANPDLVERTRLQAALNEPDRSTFYSPGDRGYLDYPSLATVG
ncbi:MAG: alkene reductase [Gemmatimonadaceae bacterium]